MENAINELKIRIENTVAIKEKRVLIDTLNELEKIKQKNDKIKQSSAFVSLKTIQDRIKHCINQFRLAGERFDWGSCDHWDTELKIAQKTESDIINNR